MPEQLALIIRDMKEVPSKDRAFSAASFRMNSTYADLLEAHNSVNVIKAECLNILCYKL